jgi:regulator of protease activity HflC (stomatin/prohibitin superfamily)
MTGPSFWECRAKAWVLDISSPSALLFFGGIQMDLSVIILIIILILIIVIVLVGLSVLRVANQYQRAVVLRPGVYQSIRGPGLYWLIPLIEWQFPVDIRTVTAAVEEQETITKDNVPVKINAVVWYRIFDPKKAILEVRSVDNAVIQVALTTLRTGIGQYSLDDVLKEQETVSATIGNKIDAVTERWGVKVERVEEC